MTYNNKNNNNNGSNKRKSPPPPPPVNTNKKQTSITDFFINNKDKEKDKDTTTALVKAENNNIITPIKKTTTTTTTTVEESYQDDTPSKNLLSQFQNPTPIKKKTTITKTETCEEFMTTPPLSSTQLPPLSQQQQTPSQLPSPQTQQSQSQQIVIFDNDKNNKNNNNRYYVKDFLIVTETVYKRDSHLLIDDEKYYVDGIIEMLDQDSQHLFVRLYNRKGPWFQVASVVQSYQDELKNIERSIETLLEYGFIEKYKSDKDNYNEIAALLKVEQLKSIVGNFGSSSSSSSSSTSPNSKSNYLEIISGKIIKGQTTLIPSQPVYKRKVENLIGECIKIKDSVLELWKMIHHLYFFSWSTHDSKSMIVNNIMGIRYPKYTVWKSKLLNDKHKQKQIQEEPISLSQENSTSNVIDLTDCNSGEYDIDLTENDSIFQTRQSLIDFERAKKLEERTIAIYENGGTDMFVNLESVFDTCLQELGRMVSKKVHYSFALRFTPGWVYTRILSWSIGILEKLKKYQQCLDYLMLLVESPFCRGKRGGWWLRMIINYKHLQRHDDALTIAERCLKQDIYLRAGDRLAIEKQLIQLSLPPRRWKVPKGLIQFQNRLKDPVSISIAREKVSNNQAGHKAKYKFIVPKVYKIQITSSPTSSSNTNNSNITTTTTTTTSTSSTSKSDTTIISSGSGSGGSQNINSSSQKSNTDSIKTTTTISNSQSIFMDDGNSLEITSDDELFPPGQDRNKDNEDKDTDGDGNNIADDKEVEDDNQVEEIKELPELIVETITVGSVEQVALEHYYLIDKWEGIHCETSIFITLYVLYFWDLIFDSNIAHVFQSPYQSCPLDFGSDEFYYSRKESIDQRIALIQQSNNEFLVSLLTNSWNENNGCEARGVQWKQTSLDQLIVISQCLGGKLISFISRLLVEDFKNFSHGMPDLFLWKLNNQNNNNGGNGYSIKFVEVKGIGDRLRDQQRIWIDMLIGVCDVEVCHVKNK